MRRKVQLYIAGRQVDLGDDSFILYNWTREDLSNPTAVVNSSSHQVELPGTCRNNSLFGSVFRLDRRTILGIRYDGTNFDPTRKTPFILYDGNGSVLESGYCRLDAVNTHSRRHAYTVTLYGGLGSFFYALVSKSDGMPRTLADLIYAGMDGADVTDFGMQPRAEFVREAWEYLRDGYDSESAYFRYFWNVVNFAPAYNGLPVDFDASHAISSGEAYNNIPFGYTDGNGTYFGYLAGLDCALLTFSNPHTEWELCDLRWYLQRPAISVKAFIAAVCDPRNNGGYDVELDDTFFNDDNAAYASAWWTLSMIATEDRASNGCLTNVLKASKTPMQYLVDYCKHFGLLFLWDSARHTVRIVTRATFYENTSEIDLSERIDRSQPIIQDPVLADSRWYQLGDGGKGEFVEQYAKDYGRGYGIQRIDTGYEFDAGTKVLTEGNAFQDAAEVQQSNLLYAMALGTHPWGLEKVFLLPKYEQVTVELWDGDASVVNPVPFYDWYSNLLPPIIYDVPAAPGADWLPKLQTHGADNEAQDGEDVLLFFAGFKNTPSYTSGSFTERKSYFLTNDDEAMTVLAGGPCWDLRNNSTPLTSLPSFRRVNLSGRYIVDSFEWGAPAVRPVLNVTYPSGKPTTLFAKWWQAYLRDRYNVDTRVLTAMVDLRGLPVGQALLRRFYWYDNAVWVLNAIRNHPLTSYDLTECEFVRVQDKKAYISGPGADLSQYLIIEPDAASFALDPSGEALALTLKSSSAWTLSLSTIVSWLTVSASSGSAGTSALTLTATPNTSTGRRQVTVTLTNTEGETLSFNVTQAQKAASSLSLSPSSITIPAAGTATDGTASRGRSCRVTADGAWDVDWDNIPAWLTVIKSSVGVTLKATTNGGAERSASVKIFLTGEPDTYATLSVVQLAGEGGTGDISLLDGEGNDSATVQAAGGSLTLYLTIPDGADWTISKSASWVTVSPVSGSGNGTIAVTVPAYSGSSDRQATITAVRDGYTEGTIFYLHQAAPTAAQDEVDITRRDDYLSNNVEIANTVSYEGFDVYASGPWTASANVSWLHVYGSAWSGNATGSNPVTRWFKADANTGAARTGIITVSLTGTSLTAKFYVYQAGDGTIYLDASFNKSRIDASAQELYLTVQAAAGVQWTIDQVSAGLTPAQLSGTGTQEVTVQVSAASAQRTLSLRVRNAAYGLSVSPSCVQLAPAASDYLRVTPFGTVNVAASDTRKVFTVESSTAWQVLTSDADLTIAPATGNGNMSVEVTFPANTSGSAKNHTLTFQTTNGSGIAVQVTIHQAAASSATLEVSPTAVTIPGTGTAENVTVNASSTWSVSKSDSWITAIVVNSGLLRIGASANSGSPRTGTVTVTCGDKTRTIAVTQLSTSALEVSTDTVSLSADSGSEGAVIVYASDLWDISEYSEIPVWLEVVYPAHAGSEDGETITFRTKSANTTGSSRTATIRVQLAGNADVYEDITVTQLSQASLYATPTAINVGNTATTGFINVRSNTSWHITTIDTGLSIASAAQSGTGNKDVMFAVTDNPDEVVRRMRVIFETDDGTKTAMVTVIQEAATATIVIDPGSSLFFQTSEDPDKSVLTAVRVVTCKQAWNAASSAGWLSFSPSSGAANTPVTVTFTARGSMEDVLTATWTVTCGDKTKTLGAHCVPAPTDIDPNPPTE